MDTDPVRAAEGLHVFVWKLLRSQPPPQLACLSVEDREEVISKLVEHFIADGFQALRSYKNRGVPFAGFVAVSANRRAISRLRQIVAERARLEPIDDGPLNVPPIDPTEGFDGRIDAAQVLERVRTCLGTLQPRCQILLKAAAEELPPRELVYLLGWPSTANRKVSEMLRQCRKSLKRCVDAHA